MSDNIQTQSNDAVNPAAEALAAQHMDNAAVFRDNAAACFAGTYKDQAVGQQTGFSR